MKKLITIFLIATLFTACTDNSTVKIFGGTAKFNLPTGEKLVNVTWKDSQLWYLTTPMDSGYVPKTYKFSEKSSWGLIEGTYTLIESK